MENRIPNLSPGTLFTQLTLLTDIIFMETKYRKYSNKLTNKMHQSHKFIAWHLCVAQGVLGASSSIIMSLQLH